jgi:hypothetical protein
VEWRLTGSLRHSTYDAPETGDLELHIDSPSAPSTLALVTLGMLAGVAIAGLGIGLGYRVTGTRRPRVTSLLGGSALLGICLVLGQGVVAQGLPPTFAVAWLATGVVVIAHAFSAQGDRRAPGLLLAVAMIGIPLTLLSTTIHAAYRVPDVVASMGGLSAVAVLGGASLVWAGRQGMVPFRELSTGSRLTVVATVGLLVLLVGWTLVVAVGLTDYFAPSALYPLLAVPFVAWALWRWLLGRPRPLVYVGILLVPFAIVGGLGALVSFFNVGGSPPPPVVIPAVLSYLLIGAGGPVLAVSHAPRRLDGRFWLAADDHSSRALDDRSLTNPLDRHEPPSRRGPDEPPGFHTV